MLLADVVEADIEAPMHLLAHRSRHTDATWLGKRLQSRRHVDAIAGDVGAINDDVAEVDTNPELEALYGRPRLIVWPHRPLHINCATERGVRAGELEQHPVARGLDDPAAMLGNLRIDYALTNLSQTSERAGVVPFHVPAEADHIGDQDRGELAGNGASIHSHPKVERRRRGQTVA